MNSNIKYLITIIIIAFISIIFSAHKTSKLNKELNKYTSESNLIEHKSELREGFISYLNKKSVKYPRGKVDIYYTIIIQCGEETIKLKLINKEIPEDWKMGSKINFVENIKIKKFENN